MHGFNKEGGGGELQSKLSCPIPERRDAQSVSRSIYSLSRERETGDDLQFKNRQMDGWMVFLYVYLYIHPSIYLSIHQPEKEEEEDERAEGL